MMVRDNRVSERKCCVNQLDFITMLLMPFFRTGIHSKNSCMDPCFLYCIEEGFKIEFAGRNQISISVKRHSLTMGHSISPSGEVRQSHKEEAKRQESQKSHCEENE